MTKHRPISLLLACLLLASSVGGQQEFDAYAGPRPLVVMTESTMVHGTHPRLVLYEDGQLIFVKRARNVGDTPMDEHLIYHHVKLDQDQVEQFVQRAAAAMADVKPQYSLVPFATDLPYIELYLRDGDRQTVTWIYALREPGWDERYRRRSEKHVPPPGPTSRQWFGRSDVLPERLRALHRRLWEFDVTPSLPWTPKYVEVRLIKAWNVPAQSVPWPADWPGRESDRAIRQHDGYLILLDAALLPELRHLSALVTRNSAIELDGQQFRFTYRYVFPGEPAWEAAHANRRRQSPSKQLSYAEDGLLRRQGESEPASGRVVDQYADGEVEREITLEAGRIVGELREYHGNGQLALSAHYDGGRRHGPYVEYDQRGTQTVVGQFVEGLAQGPWQEFDTRGTLRREYEMVDGNKHGHERVLNGHAQLIKENWYEHGTLIRSQVHKPD